MEEKKVFQEKNKNSEKAETFLKEREMEYIYREFCVN